jgi:predicted ATPase
MIARHAWLLPALEYTPHGTLRCETTYEHIALIGLQRREVGQLLEAVADRKVPDTLARTIAEETNGNPFFIREVLLHLTEEGRRSSICVWRWRCFQQATCVAHGSSAVSRWR